MYFKDTTRIQFLNNQNKSNKIKNVKAKSCLYRPISKPFKQITKKIVFTVKFSKRLIKTALFLLFQLSNCKIRLYYDILKHLTTYELSESAFPKLQGTRKSIKPHRRVLSIILLPTFFYAKSNIKR